MTPNKLYEYCMRPLNFSALLKCSLTMSLFCFMLSYGYGFATPVHEHYTADDFHQVKNIMANLEYSKTAIFLDFDETVACSKATYKDKEYRVLPCPDLLRTYGHLTHQAQTSPAVLKNILNHFDRIRQYHVLDDTLGDMIQDFKAHDGAYIGICSGLPYCSLKKEVLKQVGLSKHDYHFGSPKAQIIRKALNDKFDASGVINTIILIDNSYEHVLAKFFAQIEPLIISMNCLSDSADIKIITIEYKKFTNNVNLDALIDELTWWHTAQDLIAYDD